MVPIDSIVTYRTLDLDDDISALAGHIRDSGLQIPVLVNQDYELIDGLRRIAAVRSLGNTTIEATAVTLYGPAATWIERARVHGVEAKPLTPRRIWELYETVKPLISMSRSQQMRGTNHGRGVHIDGRGTFLAATGIESESYFQAVTQLYRMTREDSLRGRLAQEAVEMVERGTFTVYMGLDYVRKRRKPGDIVKAESQVALFESVTSTLKALGYSFNQLGPIDPSIPGEKIKETVAELRNFRRQLHQVINQLEKGQNSS